MSSAISVLLERMPQRPTRLVTVVCVSASPLTVYIDGDTSVAVRARVQAGSTFASGESGLAFWAAPSLPICFKAT